MDRRRFLARSTLTVAAASSELHLSARASQSRHWQPDGAGMLARIGVLTPDFDPVPESELSAMAPEGISIHGSRVFRDRSQSPAAFTDPRHIDAAADRLTELRPNAVVLAYTGSSYALGPDADAETQARLQEHTRGIPVVLTAQAATYALHALGAKRVALIHPPWFSEEVIDQGKAYFAARGFQVLRCTRVLPARSFTEVRPAEVFDWVRENAPGEADAVFVGGNGMRAIGAIRELEAALRRPVLTANQVAFWAALRIAKVRVDVKNYGRIFDRN
jgi:maleate isomerase